MDVGPGAARTEGPGEGTGTPPKVDFYWQFLLHEDNLLQTRANIFFVAESMLAAAFATLVGEPAQTPIALACALFLCAVGFRVGYLWYRLYEIQKVGTLAELKKLVAAAEPQYAKIRQGRRDLGSVNEILGRKLPWALQMFWVGAAITAGWRLYPVVRGWLK